MDDIILIVFSVTLLLSLLAALLHLQSGMSFHDEVYCYLDDKKWKRIPMQVAEKYSKSLGYFFSFDKGLLTVVIKSIFFSTTVSLIVLITWRSFVVGSLTSALSGLFSGSLWVVVCVWAASVAVAGAFSVLITKHFASKVANASTAMAAVKFILLDLLVTYLLVSLSMYVCLLGTMPMLTWYKANFAEAQSVFGALVTFAHENALTWPTHGVVLLDGLSASILSIATVIPSLTFILSITIALLVFGLVRLVSARVMATLDWVTQQSIAKTTWYLTSLGLLLAVIGALGKVLELVKD
ncbi:hypothetical protein [Vibrio vulnificus]|uniref:hypothetical protein n=1 Tax=Vibrio vulnificus TaxID=672 RepID=UPI000502B0A0|nr:hypothetical protein [Vibrio vulnificus]EIE1227842.1 hypothetical protein [Vibrio vulnificus]EJS4046420.1 hypothetical protein [Vibrio vulnificus]KFK53379.1 hypothetical protein JS86_20220 [Vibrio vulnificus]HDY7869434.1 hypothetical protein [Vibrio vulnificus]